MNKAEFKLKLMYWTKRIGIFVGALLVILVVSKIIGAIAKFTYNPTTLDRQEQLQDSYNTPIFNSDEIEDEVKQKCEGIIKDFVKYGNQKNYQAIYDMLSEDYKSVAMESIDNAKQYIDKYFDAQKGFSYQNIVNIDNAYIYELKIYDDLMISGSNSYSGMKQNKIYFVIKDIDGNLKINLDGFVAKENVNLSTKNEYINITVLSKEVYYDKVKFNFKMENLTDNRILSIYNDDIKYVIYNGNTDKLKDYSYVSTIIRTDANNIMPQSSQTLTLTYNKYVGSEFTKDYSININTIYSYDLADFLEVIFDNPNITQKASETYSNIYISL